MDSDSNERDIFSFTRRGVAVFGDPLALERRLWRLAGDLDDLITQVHSPSPAVSFEAVERLRSAVCKAFDLGPPFDPLTGQGVLEAEWMGLLNSFCEFLEKNASKAGSSPTSLPPTGPASSAAP